MLPDLVGAVFVSGCCIICFVLFLFYFSDIGFVLGLWGLLKVGLRLALVLVYMVGFGS